GEIAYEYNGRRHTLDDYLEHQRVTALLILKDDRVIVERYRYDRQPADRFLSFSMAKSIVSMLAGIALDKGILSSLDDPAAKYVPELAGSGYGNATIGQLLRMSSGVKFVEQYDGRDDIARLRRARLGASAESPLEVLASFREQSFPAGEKMGYSSAETAVVGYVLARAAQQNLATLTAQWLWQPLGAEAEASWQIGIDGQEQAEGGFNATLRDYARLGWLLAHDGRRGPMQIVPAAYLLDATDPTRQPEAFRPRAATPYFGYGYQFWLFPMRSRTFALLGIYGQSIFVQPESKIVMVHTAAYANPKQPDATIERDALWRGVLAILGGNPQP
ncbi:MAG TPA: serine hydrolase, partial [Pirellulales bacterium]|nr:serine hydrolase [Pirellulales bacterium]